MRFVIALIKNLLCWSRRRLMSLVWTRNQSKNSCWHADFKIDDMIFKLTIQSFQVSYSHNYHIKFWVESDHLSKTIKINEALVDNFREIKQAMDIMKQTAEQDCKEAIFNYWRETTND